MFDRLLTHVLARVRHTPGRTVLVALAGAAVALATGAVAAVLKVLVDRPRPSAAFRIVAETDPSFPSGHATGTMALGVGAAVIVTVYLLRRPIARLLSVGIGVALPLAVAASRLELGV